MAKGERDLQFQRISHPQLKLSHTIFYKKKDVSSKQVLLKQTIFIDVSRR